MGVENNNKKNDLVLAVFFSYGVGIETWQRQGIIDRELALYTRLIPFFKKIYFFTYDTLSNHKEIDKDLIVVPNSSWLPNFLYSLFMPFVHRKLLSSATIYKTNQMYGSWSAVIAKWFFHKPLVVRAGFRLSTNARHLDIFRKTIARMIERLALMNADYAIATTREDAEYYQFFATHVTVIPNFVDTELFSPKIGGGDGSVRTLLYVGRLSKEKNLGNLIEAVCNLPNVQLLIVGDGEERASLEGQAKNSQAPVVFKGKASYAEVANYMKQADVFVLPSLYEGNPKVILEAMASGLPVVATNVRGINTLIEHGVTGFLTGIGSKEIRCGIETLLKNPQMCLQLGKTARERAVEHYTLKKISKKELVLYSCLLS
ncbi:MAG: glycosyltransferase family 4 protein [Candidatus Magasanikbacteria bacterium]